MSKVEDIYSIYHKRLGARVKELRESKGLSLNDMAAMNSNWEKTTISRIENGRTNITLNTALRLCIALEIEFQDLFDMEIDKIHREHDFSISGER